MASPVVQGGLEIPVKVSVTWNEPEKLSILEAKVKEVEYPLTGEYIDESINILKEIGIEKDEDDDEVVEFNVNNDNKDIQIL